MATKVYKEESFELQGGKEVTVRPLVIGRLRRFLDAWQAGTKLKDSEDGFTIFINCCGIALEHNFKGEYDSLKADPAAKKKGEVLSAEYKEFLEDNLELDTIYKVMDIAGGIDLTNPKLLEAAMEAAAEEDGKN